MLNIDPIVTPQANTPAFKNKATCEKLAAQKLYKLTESTCVEMPERNKKLLNFINSYCEPVGKKLQLATDYLANEASKSTSSKMAAEKLSKLTQDFVV